MENKNKPDKIQFTKLHEKVQRKYEEMQKKLDKSKSIDILYSANSNFINKNERRYASAYDLDVSKNLDNVFTDDKIELNNKSSISFQNIQDTEVEVPEIMIEKCDKSKSKSLSSLKANYLYEQDENNVFGNNSCKTSVESLNEAKDSDDSGNSQSPTPKSLRHLISSKLNAVKVRRQREREKRRSRKELHEEVEKFILSNTTKYDYSGIEKKIKQGTVTVALIEVSGFEEDSEEKHKSLMCRLRLGAEKRKSKIIKSHLSVVKFQEIFNIEQYEDEYILEVTVSDKDGLRLIGRTVIDLSVLKKEKTHEFRNILDGDARSIEVFMLLTISGSLKSNTLYEIDQKQFEDTISSSKRKYAWYRLCGDFTNVGCLWIIVFGAKGLSGHDCYCVLNLNNESLRTATDYKTNTPSWMKIFSFVVTDITSSLDVIIIDEKKSEEVGRVTIPLLEVESGKNKWYALKDTTLRQGAKGTNPRVLLEMNISWNLIKAAARVINIKESNYLQSDEKLDRHLFARNLSRAKAVTSWTLDCLKIFKCYFQWDSWRVNLIAIVVWVLFWTYGKIWMTPLLLLVPFVVCNHKKIQFSKGRLAFVKNESSDIESETKSDKDEKTVSLRQRINSWQEMIQVVQNSIGKFASFGESIKNLYNFSSPFVSCIAIFIILLITVFMYIIPFNYICIGWGIHKYTQKIFRPNRNPHNEILDLISRVPDDEALEKQKQIPVYIPSDDGE